MRRTRATLAALERDVWLCQYHMHVLKVAHVATDGHHMFGRQVDRPEAIIALCRECHTKLHNGEIDKNVVIQIQVARGIITDDEVDRLHCEKVSGKGRGDRD